MDIGIDLGGSHIAVGLVNNLELLDKVEENIRFKDGEHMVDNIEEKIGYILSKNSVDSIESIGIACPGTIKDGCIYKASNLGFKNFNLKEVLEKRFPNIQIKIKNDAKCAAIAEFRKGNLKGHNDSIFLCLGTGIGGAVFLKGQLLETTHFSGFEIGHMVIEKDGIQCTCGKKGCFERYASMKALKETIRKEYKVGNDVHSEELINILADGSSKSEQILNNFLESLKIGLGNLIDIFEPEIIVIGGSFAFYGDFFLPKLNKMFNENNVTFNERNDIKITVAKLGNDAGIIGSV